MDHLHLYNIRPFYRAIFIPEPFFSDRLYTCVHHVSKQTIWAVFQLATPSLIPRKVACTYLALSRFKKTHHTGKFDRKR